MTQEATWWSGYDPVTFQYNGMRLSVEQPANATAVGIGNLINPVWNPSLNEWEGADLAKQLADLQAKAETTAQTSATETLQQDIANLTSAIAKDKATNTATISDLMKEVATLKTQGQGGTTNA